MVVGANGSVVEGTALRPFREGIAKRWAHGSVRVPPPEPVYALQRSRGHTRVCHAMLACCVRIALIPCISQRRDTGGMRFRLKGYNQYENECEPLPTPGGAS